MIELEISAFENQSVQVFSISHARTTIGRNPQNDIVVDCGIMSGAHAEIVRADDGELSIEDLGSINGTFVNDEQITSSPIESGDKLRFGNIEGLLTESERAEPPVFGSLAISQAKQAMQNLQKGLPSGSSQPVKLESGAVGEAAAASETASRDTVAPDGPTQAPQGLSNEPAPTDISASGENADAGVELAGEATDGIESLMARISELEENESGLVLTNQALTERLDEASSLLEAKIAESEETNADSVELRERLVRSEIALSEKAGAITELSEQLGEKEAALADRQKAIAGLEANLDAKKQQADQSAVGKIERAASEAAALRAELDELKAVHGEVSDAREQLGEIQQEQSAQRQEIESFQSQRARSQRELEDFLAKAEAARAAANEENAEVTSALEASREQLEVLNRAVNEAQQQEDLRTGNLLASIRKLEQRRDTEADELTGIEERKAAAELQLNEVALSTEAMESKCRDIGSQVAKDEKALKGIQRKIGRRKKLLERLKTVARRERELAKKIEEGKRYLEEAEAHKQAGTNPSQVQPWDVDRARADRDKAIEEAKIIQQEADLVKAALRVKQAELDRLEAEIRQKQQANPFRSGIGEDPGENGRESGDTSRLAAQLREVRQGLAPAEML